MKKLLLLSILFTIISCNQTKDTRYLGRIEKLPPGIYYMESWGSRHIIRCTRPDGKYYCLNDSDLPNSGLPYEDAHRYHDERRVVIK